MVMYKKNVLSRSGNACWNWRRCYKKKDLILGRFKMLKNIGLQGLATERKGDMMKMKQTKNKQEVNCIQFDI